MSVIGRMILDQCMAEVAMRIWSRRGCFLVIGSNSRNGLLPGLSLPTRS
jgi:hypothetical protein